MTTLSTQNYEKFKYLIHNRPISLNLVERLKTSISYKNLLAHKPILIDKDFYVIDGQHRLEAAKELGIPIFYTISKDESICSVDDIVALQTVGIWTFEDFLNAHIKASKKEYLKLLEIMKKYKLSLTQALIFSKGSAERKRYERFKQGELELQNINEISEKMDSFNVFIKYIKEKQIIHSQQSSWVRSKAFFKAFLTIMDNPDFEFDVFMKKLPYGLTRLRPCANWREYYHLFAGIFNIRNQKPLEETFYAT